jgi:hypothetical protein
MNIENITSLAAQLQSLGFENTSSTLLKRICFRPEIFILSQKIAKGRDQFVFNLFFERDSRESFYTLMHYDAILQKESLLVDTIINGISTADIEKRMAEIDWKAAFDIDMKKQWSASDKTSWEKELKVESAVEALQILESSDEGKAIADGLKLKYWADMPYQELNGNISPLKNKSEISQRFYFSEGQPGISVDEAYRFLQNRWLEKQMQAKRKLTEISQTGDTENDSQASSGSGLLKKKRFGTTKSGKKNKTVQH